MPKCDLIVINSTSGRGLSLRAVGNSSSGSWRPAVTQSFHDGQAVVLVDRNTYDTLMDSAKERLRVSQGERKQAIKEAHARVRKAKPAKRALKDMDKKSKLRRKPAKR